MSQRALVWPEQGHSSHASAAALPSGRHHGCSAAWEAGKGEEESGEGGGRGEGDGGGGGGGGG